MARGSRQETKRAVIAAATAVFSEFGYAGTTVDAIAERAGLTTGALYSNFTGKRDVFLAVLRHAVGYGGESPASGQQRLEADGSDFMRSVESDPTGVRLLLWAVLEADRDPDVREVAAQVLRDQRVLQQHIVAELLGTTPDSGEAADVGVLLNSMAIGFVVQRLVDPQFITVERGERILQAEIRRLRAAT